MESLGLSRALSLLVRYGFPEASPEDRAAFEAYADKVSEGVIRYFIPALAGIALVFWPTDALLYSDPAVRHALGVWRFSQIAILGAVYLLARLSPAVRSHARETLALTGLVCFGFGARVAMTMGQGNSFAALLYLAPFCSTVIVVTPRKRVALLAAITVVTIASAHDANPAFPYFTLFAAAMTATAMVAFIIGHSIFYLLFQNFFQQRAIERTAERLTAVDRMKSEFFANVSHELRTPLTLILGSLRTIAALPGQAIAPEAIETGLRNARRLLLLVNEILELARVAGGQKPTETRPVDIAAMLRRIVGDFDSTSGGQSSFALVGVDAPIVMSGNSARLKKVFYNLLSNAVKFTDPETRAIRVVLAVTERDIVVTVSDNGIGIPDADLERVFERFVQVESSAARRYEGTGIGLALVKGIVTQAGGTVVARSELGKGSTFIVTLPRGDTTARPATAIEEDDDEDEAPRPIVAGESVLFDTTAPFSEQMPGVTDDRPRLLLVEDNADLRRYARGLLARRYRVRTARDGAEGLELAQSYRPDLVVTDVMMPKMSGVDLLQAIRADSDLRDTPVVFLTARAGMEARSEALEGGADDYVSKPFEERELVARVENLLIRSRQARSLTAMNSELEARVEARTAELRALAAHLSELLEQERARIARDIHDDLGQTLTAMRLEVDHAARGIAKDGDLGQTMARLSRLLEATLTSSRRILAELRPQGLEELGLMAVIERLAGEFRERHGCVCDLSIDPDFDTDPKRATALFRIIQECLNNVGKHAAAKRVEIALAVDDDLIRLVVRDDGRGLPVGPPRTGAMGLLGMRERAWQFGGHVTIAGEAGRGTTVDVEIPVRDSGSEEQSEAAS